MKTQDERKTELIKNDAHILCIKDMAGLLTPKSGHMLIDGLRQRFPGEFLSFTARMLKATFRHSNPRAYA